MLDARYVADHLDEVRAGLKRRSDAAAQALDTIHDVSERRRAAIGELEQLQAKRNAANKDMAALAKGGDKELFAKRRDEMKALGAEIKERETALHAIEDEMRDLLLHVPNIPHPSAPDGKTEADNRVVRTHGEKPTFDFEPKEHVELGEKLGIVDFERAAKLSGARFSVLWAEGARLSRALIGYMLDLHTTDHGYREVYTPYLVKADALRGTSQLPKFEADLFKTHRHGATDADDAQPLYMIPTAEVSITNLHADEILDGAALPIAYTAHTPCFRSEAGSYGKDVRGLIRQHQFEKVELVRFATPEEGEAQLDELTSNAEAVLQGLGLHYRVVELCAGDLGFGAAKTYDIEVWLPGQNAYREISSCSWFGDYQARRAKIRFKPEPKSKARLVHTVNGSGLAVGRTWIAIVEQFQQADGSVTIPEALRSRVGVDVIKPPSA